MNRMGRAAMIVAVAATGAGAAPRESREVFTPVATYWVSAQTTTGLMAGIMGANGRPSMGSIAGMMMRGGPRADAVNHGLRLQLGSMLRPSGEPRAEHDPPAGLGLGASLPLVTPRPTAQPVAPVDETPSREPPREYQRPKGRMLIYWGCGEHAGPGQPFVIDFAKVTAGQQSFAGLMSGLAVAAMQPPSPSRAATYGEWPNDKTRGGVSAQASLVGDHLVKGDYTPDINFQLGPAQDFMAPLHVVNSPMPSGAAQLSWLPIRTATGYVAFMVGAGGHGGGDGADIVMWTSSNTQAPAFGFSDYLAPGEVRRLVAAGRFLGPQTSQCVVPQEVTQGAPAGLLTMTAYGEEANFRSPAGAPTPWAVKVRYRSSTSVLLGMGGGQDRPRRPFGLGGLIP
jgi:hypothetical protein